MFYEGELLLIRSTFQKCRVHTTIAELPAGGQTPPWNNLFRPFHDITLSPSLFPTPKPEHIYRVTLPMGARYLFFLLPELPRSNLFVVGPYLPQHPTSDQVVELCEQYHIPPHHLKELESYLGNIPVLAEGSHIFIMLDAFAERIWGTQSYVMEDISGDSQVPLPTLQQSPAPDGASVQWNIRDLETRYGYEAELMDAVAKGQIHKADLLLNSFTAFSFEQRLSDPVRNAKNYCIIMNTLLRKAAQQGGVHPLYLDSTSSVFAHRIEQVTHPDSIPHLMHEMFRSYCRLVRNRTLSGYSPLIQKAITCIDAELTGALQLQDLANVLNVSSSYLSALFKKEVGQTLTEFVNQRRINHAQHLLKHTHLQVQTVAQHCGMEDVQYFSKLFKRYTGVTPRQYRDSGGQ